MIVLGAVTRSTRDAEAAKAHSTAAAQHHLPTRASAPPRPPPPKSHPWSSGQRVWKVPPFFLFSKSFIWCVFFRLVEIKVLVFRVIFGVTWCSFPHAYPQCLPSGRVPIQSRVWTCRPPTILHRVLAYRIILS